MTIRIGLIRPEDSAWMRTHARHIRPDMLERKIQDGEILIARCDSERIGWLRWGYLWDAVPFMNMLYVMEGERGKGYGRQLVRAWEELMLTNGHLRVMVSTQSDEDAQHFYRKLGYTDCGGFFLPGEVLEILLVKSLRPG